jgi:glyoxylase-like metal-dependent hydrolase (beta-lactamase superfamily II)
MHFIIIFLISFVSLASYAMAGISVIDAKDYIKKQESILIDINSKSYRLQNGTLLSFNNKESGLTTLMVDIQTAASTDDESIVIYSNDKNKIDIARILLGKSQFSNVKYFLGEMKDLDDNGLDIKYFTKYIRSPLYSRPTKVNDRVYSSIGATQPPSYSNYGHNNNLSFIIGDTSVLVFNAGGSYLLAQALHEEIKALTPLPVKYLVYENHQAHATMGSAYWKEQGTTIIAHRLTKAILINDFAALSRAKSRLRDHFFKSAQLTPDVTFESTYNIDLGGIKIELKYMGEAHEADDIMLWIPSDKILISGDLLFNQRMLPLQTHTNIRSWLAIWPEIEKLNPKIVIPGHGGVTDMNTVALFTKDYLEFLLNTVESILDDDGDLIDAITVDASRFNHFHLFNILSKQNLERLFRRMEFE